MNGQTPYDTALETLLALGPPRVWSLIVTVFGDLARNPDDRIDGRLLTQLMNGMDVKPEATRVALHRLRKDGWIVSRKTGRVASHALTEAGRRESEAASPLIYAPLDRLPNSWKIVVVETNDTEDKARMEAAGYVALFPRVFVSAGNTTTPEGVVETEGAFAPPWLAGHVVPDDLTGAYRDLHMALTGVGAALPDGAAPDPLETAILRCLIVHNWRRLVLKMPYLPPGLLGRDWPGHQCREKVGDLLARLTRPSLAALSAD